MTITSRVLVKIVLMIFFCRIEVLQRQYLNNYWLVEQSLLLGKNFSDNRQFAFIGVIDTCAIAGAIIVTLFVKTCRLDSVEEHIKKELQIDNLLVILDTHRLSITCGIGTSL